MASIQDAIKKASQNAGGAKAPTVKVADSTNLTANSSSGIAA